MTDHLAAARTAYAALLGRIINQLEAGQPALAPDRDPECVKRWPECEPSAYNPACCRWPKSCSCNVLPAPDPLDETNHADRHDRDGDRWWWCDKCYGFRVARYHYGKPKRRLGWPAAEIDSLYGPLTFAPRPADTPTTAPQPDEVHGDAAQPNRPKLNVQTGPSVTIPTTEQVRKAYVHAYAPQQFFGPAASADRAGLGAEFDRWLEAHDAALREQIATEVRDALDTHTMTLTESTARAVSHGYRTARAIALGAIHNPKEQP